MEIGKGLRALFFWVYGWEGVCEWGFDEMPEGEMGG
jgi:hypothetical protein